MVYGSVCSGIEAATVAWHPLGWKPSFFSEIDAFPRKLLAHHYPQVPLHGDFTTIQKGQYEPIELLVGGTPCQSFSVAGLRAGLADPRGNLMLEFGALADRLRPLWLVWENVPGVLSSNGGRDFGSFLGMLGELGYGFAYRVLDAKYFGVPQRRRRVFVVGCLGDWRSAAAVLFERHCLSGDSAPSRQTRKDVTQVAGTLTSNGGGLNRPAGNANELDFCITTNVANTLTKSPSSYASANPSRQEGNLVLQKTCSGKDQFGTLMANCGTKQWLGNQEELSGDYHVFGIAGNIINRKPENGGNGDGWSEDVGYTLTKTDQHAVAYGVNEKPDLAHCLRSGASKADKHESTTYTQHNMAVRRLMPIECERLQGFPDNYTNIPGASDSNRYKALGNSMAVPVMRWIGERIELIKSLKANQ